VQIEILSKFGPRSRDWLPLLPTLGRIFILREEIPRPAPLVRTLSMKCYTKSSTDARLRNIVRLHILIRWAPHIQLMMDGWKHVGFDSL